MMLVRIALIIHDNGGAIVCVLWVVFVRSLMPVIVLGGGAILIKAKENEDGED